MAEVVQLVWRGTVIHALSLDQVEVLNNAVLGIFSKGTVAFLRSLDESMLKPPNIIDPFPTLLYSTFVTFTRSRPNLLR